MLIARAPLRVSFGGGGTDLPAYYERFGGLVVSTTINKYVYAHVAVNGSGSAQISSADYQTFYRHHCGTPLRCDGQLALPQAILREFGVDRGLSIFIASEVPPGTGLGSSSAVAVALIQSIAAYLGRPLSRRGIAELACKVEIERLQAPIGKQDQYAAAFGGLNAFSFTRDGVTVEPVRASAETIETLGRRLMLFFTGTARNSAAILRGQQHASAQDDGETIRGLHRLRAIGQDCRWCLERGDLEGLGELIDSGWQSKRRLAAGITNASIDKAYDVAKERGALGGKITGAGGGGFLMLYCREECQEAVTEALENLGLHRMDFHLERQGVTVSEVSWVSPEVAAVTALNSEKALAALAMHHQNGEAHCGTHGPERAA
jgi:D-glycero-alpha-D-manno-heptose-7-phosphate kinase